jgi:hypothetical protein
MKKIDPSKIKTYSLKERPSKVRLDEAARPHRKGGSFRDFFASLPGILLAPKGCRGIMQARDQRR